MDMGAGNNSKPGGVDFAVSCLNADRSSILDYYLVNGYRSLNRTAMRLKSWPPVLASTSLSRPVASLLRRGDTWGAKVQMGR